MIKTILLLISIFFSLNLVPDKDKAITLDEYNIRCYSGTYTYKIENSDNRKYLVLIKASSISKYDLYGGDNGDKILSYEKSIYYDYFYPLNGNKTLYFVIQTYSSLCFSYMFSDYNYIYLKNGEEYKHPIVNYETRIYTEIENVSGKHFIFCVGKTWEPYTIRLNGETYRKTKTNEIISMIPEKNNMTVYLDMGSTYRVISLKYMTNSYINITDDTYKCISYDDIKTYFINKANDYLMISFTDDSQYEFYENDKPTTINENYIYSLASSNFFFLPKLDACFQLSFLDKSSIEINNGYSLKIINSKNYEFIINNNDFKSLDTNIILYINSTSNNFIKSLKINHSSKTINIEQKDNDYFYKISFFPEEKNKLFDINVDIIFNLDSQDYIIVKFKVETIAPKKKSYLFVIGIVVPIVLLPIIYILIKYYCKVYKDKKKEEYNKIKKDMKLLEEKNALDKGSEFYSRIKDDYSYINKICVLCNDLDDTVPIDYEDSYYYDHKEINIINDINNGEFENFYDYVTPKKCYHSFHDGCCKKNRNYKKYFKDPKNCLFCNLYLTCENFQKFGLFFSENFVGEFIFNEGKKEKRLKLFDKKKKMIREIENIFYSKIESSDNIDNQKKENLLKIRKMNKTFLDNFRYVKSKDNFACYKININEITDSMIDDLDYEIKKQREKIEEKNRRLLEEKRANRKVPLRVCSQCRRICVICGGDAIFSRKSNIREKKTLGAHERCSDEDGLCYMCGKKGNENAQNYCFDCDKEGKNLSEECYYCHEGFSRNLILY